MPAARQEDVELGEITSTSGKVEVRIGTTTTLEVRTVEELRGALKEIDNNLTVSAMYSVHLSGSGDVC